MSQIEKQVSLEQNINQKQVEAEQIMQQRYKSFGFLVFIVMNYCLAYIYIGYNIVYFGTFTIDNLFEIFEINGDKNLFFAFLMGILPLGAIIGSFKGIILTKYFSRRNSLIIVNIFSILISGVSMIQNIEVLFFCRFMQGLFIGFYNRHISYLIKQIIPRQTIDTFKLFPQIFLNIGIFIAFCLQYSITVNYLQVELWRIMFAVLIYPITIQTIILTLVFKFETPKYLLEQNRQKECKQLLRKIYKQQFVQKILQEKKKQLKNQRKKQDNQINQIKKQNILTQKQFKSKSSQTNPQNDQTTQKIQQDKDLHNPQIKSKKSKSRLRYFIAIQLSILQQFCGFQVYTAYGVHIISPILPDLAILIPMILSIVTIIGTLVTKFLLENFGRKIIVQIGTIFVIISLIFTITGYLIDERDSQIVLILMGYCIFMLSFSIFIGPLIFVYVDEIVDNQFIPVTLSVNWGAATFVCILFPILSSMMDNSALILMFFALWCIGSLIFNKIFMIQTKDKSQKQIYKEYDLKYNKI